MRDSGKAFDVRVVCSIVSDSINNGPAGNSFRYDLFCKKRFCVNAAISKANKNEE